MKLATLIALSIASATSAYAEPLQLKFGTTGPAFGPLHEEAYSAWAKDVTAASQGTLEVKVFPGSQLVTMGNAYDRVLNGVAEVAFIVLGPISSQFPRTTVVGLPYIVATPMEAAQALWNAYEHRVFANEFDKCHPVALAAFSNTTLHARKPFATLEDIKGWKIGAQSRVTGEVGEKLGGSAVSLPVAESYQALSRGTIDAYLTGWPAIVPFKMQEVTIAHVDTPLAAEMAFNCMNKEVYAKLPAPAKAAVDKYSGMPFSERMARAISKMADQGRAAVMARKDSKMLILPPKEEERWKQRLAPIVEEWTKATPDGAKVLAQFQGEVAKVRAAAKK
jgi:TRAP-type C4-dicarboxylate transport system substrate-binding protein